MTNQPEVDAFLVDVMRRLEVVLGDRLTGVWGFGSLAAGDFDPASSDLDLLVATAGELTDAEAEALRDMHVRIESAGGPWAKRLEVLYLPVPELSEATRTRARRTAYMSPDTPLTVFTGFDPSWELNLETARAGGATFAGPAPATLIPPVPPDRIREAVRELLRDEWSKSLGGPDWMRPRRYQAFVVLTMCRALHALESGVLLTKPRAAAWALQSLDARWHDVIRWSLAARANHSTEPATDDLPRTLAFLRFAVSRSNESGC